MQKGVRTTERLRETLCLRISDEMRIFLEEIADNNKISLGEAARKCIEYAMKNMQGD